MDGTAERPATFQEIKPKLLGAADQLKLAEAIHHRGGSAGKGLCFSATRGTPCGRFPATRRCVRTGGSGDPVPRHGGHSVLADKQVFLVTADGTLPLTVRDLPRN